MTYSDILATAMRQSAVDSGCCAGDFTRGENIVVISKKSDGARRYLSLPFLCDLTSYGDNIVASVSEDFYGIAHDYINRYAVMHCFETPNLNRLIDAVRPLVADVCFMAEYFLPSMKEQTPPECGYGTRVLTAADLGELYIPQWSNALCAARRELDVLGVGAYDGDKLIGLAGCSDCEAMWQIGVDVLPEYRRRGVASAITSRLSREILSRGIVPFYCCAWSNIRSARNAIRSGFVPAWVQVTIKPRAFVESMNNAAH